MKNLSDEARRTREKKVDYARSFIRWFHFCSFIYLRASELKEATSATAIFTRRSGSNWILIEWWMVTSFKWLAGFAARRPKRERENFNVHTMFNVHHPASDFFLCARCQNQLRSPTRISMMIWIKVKCPCLAVLKAKPGRSIVKPMKAFFIVASLSW